MNQLKPLSQMSLTELEELRARWLKEASEIGEDDRNKWDRLCLIACMLGERETGLSKWSVFECGLIIVRAALISGTVTVTINNHSEAKLVADSKGTMIYIPGWWEEQVFAHYEAALAKQRKMEEIAARKKREAERQTLLKAMTLPPPYPPDLEVCLCPICNGRPVTALSNTFEQAG